MFGNTSKAQLSLFQIVIYSLNVNILGKIYNTKLNTRTLFIAKVLHTRLYLLKNNLRLNVSVRSRNNRILPLRVFQPNILQPPQNIKPVVAPLVLEPYLIPTEPLRRLFRLRGNRQKTLSDTEQIVLKRRKRRNPRPN